LLFHLKAPLRNKSTKRRYFKSTSTNTRWYCLQNHIVHFLQLPKLF
jgi:hypothetical protein